MNVSSLIDAIVRQTTILLAQLATAERGRAQLAHTANQVFLDLVEQLKDQGLSSKVIADMFGLALRTYQERVRRLSESRTVGGRSLWEAVLEHIQDQGPLSRAAVLQRFRNDDGVSVKGVLSDLVQSGLVYKTGRGTAVTYRRVDATDVKGAGDDGLEARMNLVWIAVQRSGPVARDALTLPFTPSELDAAIAAAVARGHLQAEYTAEGELLRSHGCLLPYEAPEGWEAAVFDHYQALVTALCTKLRSRQQHAERDDVVGGSTFGLTVWHGHPHFDETLGLLRLFREQGSALREKVRVYNEHHAVPLGHQTKVVAYVGQYVVEPYDQMKDEISL